MTQFQVPKVNFTEAREALRTRGWDHARLMDEARKRATDPGLFTDDPETVTEEQYLVADMADVVEAFYQDIMAEVVHEVDFSEVDDGAEAFCKRHGIELLN